MRNSRAAALLISLFGFVIPCPSQSVGTQSGTCPPSIGILLTGGGSFGAFEAGALKKFFEEWSREHAGAPPPVGVIAGTSSGALIAPFVALGSSGVDEVADLYRNVGQSDILSFKAQDLLPFALFAKWSSSAYGLGPLKRKLQAKLPDSRLREIASLWPCTRLAVLATDFKNGTAAPFTNSPEDMASSPARFRAGVLASAASPLATPPVYVDPSRRAPPHLDGGIHAVAPFQLLFDLAARAPAIELTQVVVFSAYPRFPGKDTGSVQGKDFPDRPGFADIGSRMDALISESSITKEISLAWAAIQLCRKGVSAEEVKKGTGLYVPNAPQELLLYAPGQRLGWDNLKFDKKQMRKMYDSGYQATAERWIP